MAFRYQMLEGNRVVAASDAMSMDSEDAWTLTESVLEEGFRPRVRLNFVIYLNRGPCFGMPMSVFRSSIDPP